MLELKTHGRVVNIKYSVELTNDYGINWIAMRFMLLRKSFNDSKVAKLFFFFIFTVKNMDVLHENFSSKVVYSKNVEFPFL